MKKKKELTFKDVYQLPLKIDKFCPFYTYSSNGVMTFDNLIYEEKTLNDILAMLNGDSKTFITNDVTYENGEIKIDNRPIFEVRGWGHLTGCGALNLPAEKAAKIQDDFANWVVNKLKGVEV